MELDRYKALVDSIYLLTLGEAQSGYTPSEVLSYISLPIDYKRCQLYYDGTDVAGLVTWCWLTPDKGTRFLLDEYTPTEEDYKLENPDGDYQLWGIEFITPYGHALQVMRHIRKLHKELYGTTTKVHFRRFSDRHKLHKRTF